MQSLTNAPTQARLCVPSRHAIFTHGQKPMKNKLHICALSVGLAAAASPALALNILLCNDDGIVAANLRATKQKLVAAGHQVLVTGPVDNQSGRGGYIAFLAPVGALTGTERSAKALGLAAGVSGVGTDPADANVSYVNGTPVAACLYGIDVRAPQKWGSVPDLVISGPNEGNNTGHTNMSSGTFNNMVYAVNREIPTMAVSDATSTQVNWSATLAADHRAFEVADIVVKLVDALVSNKAKAGGLLMPVGMGLNVNIPDFAAGAGKTLPFKFTRIGKATAYSPAFYEKLSESSLAVASGVNFPLPGISLAVGGTVLPTGVKIPKDDAATSEANVIAAKTAITISPIEGVPQARRAFEDALKIKLSGFAQ
jgi:5'-nucleotidase